MTPLLWAIVLLATAMGIIVLEMFLPSGGILAICAAAAAISAVVIVFMYHGMLAGTIFFAISCVLLGLTGAGAIKWWPHTSIGRQMLNLPPGQQQEIASPPDYSPLQSLVGLHGISVSKMVPGGVISIAGKSYDAVSQAGVIEEGTPVSVIAVDGTRIIVRIERVASIEAADDPPASSEEDLPSTPDDRPNVIPNPFEDPLV